jgi:hypothetical protein
MSTNHVIATFPALRNFVLLNFLLLTSCFVSAQVPHRFNYQCAVRDANGEIAANYAVTIRFTFRNANGGSVAYQEKHDTNTNEFGLVNVDIGTGEVTQFSWNNLDWWGFEYLLQVEVDLGSGFVDTGTSEFGAVPFSILSEKAINMNLGDLNDVETYMGVSEGDVLRFNADENYWEPQPLPAMVDGVWSSNATNAWRIGGNVGIGTATPASGLHLHNKGGLRLTTTFTGSTWLDGFYIGQDADNANVILSNFENGPIIFQTNFAERMRISANGNFGIGTNEPMSPFHLANVNVGGDVYSKWTTPITGHTATDGAHLGVNTIGQMVIDQKENYDILVKRNGSTKAIVNSTGLDVNGTLTSDDVTTGTLTSVSAEVTSVDAFITTTENLYINSATGSGNRPLYANQDGQVYAVSAVQYMHIPGCAFILDRFGDGDQASQGSAYVFWGDHPQALCPVYLPDGATVTSVVAYINDTFDLDNIFIHLIRTNPSTGSEITMASFLSSGSSGITGVEDNTISNAEIDNVNYVYWLYAAKTGVDAPAGEILAINSIRFAYTLP